MEAGFKKVKNPSSFFILADTTDSVYNQKWNNYSTKSYFNAMISSDAEPDVYHSVYEAHKNILTSAYLDGRALAQPGKEFIKTAIQSFRDAGQTSVNKKSYIDYYGVQRILTIP